MEIGFRFLESFPISAAPSFFRRFGVKRRHLVAGQPKIALSWAWVASLLAAAGCMTTCNHSSASTRLSEYLIATAPPRNATGLSALRVVGVLFEFSQDSAKFERSEWGVVDSIDVQSAYANAVQINNQFSEAARRELPRMNVNISAI